MNIEKKPETLKIRLEIFSSVAGMLSIPECQIINSLQNVPELFKLLTSAIGKRSSSRWASRGEIFTLGLSDVLADFSSKNDWKKR